MTKPLSPTPYNSTTPLPVKPSWGLIAGTGTSTPDDTAAGGPPGVFTGGAAWHTDPTYGPVVRLSSDGDCLTFADSPALLRARTGFTLALGVRPSSFPGDAAHTLPSAYVGKQIGTSSQVFGVDGWSSAGDTVGRFLGVDTPAGGAVLTAGTAYCLVLRAGDGLAVNLRVYDRATGLQVGPDSVSVAAVPSCDLSGSTGHPMTLGQFATTSAGNLTQPGDYEFLAMSASRWSDGQCDAFALNPFGNYTAAPLIYAFTGPATGLPGAPSTFTATLDPEAVLTGPATVTLAVTGMTAVVSGTITLTNTVRSGTATVTPDPATADPTAGHVTASSSGALIDPGSPLAFAVTFGPVPNLAAYRAFMDYPVGLYPSGGVNLNGEDHYDLTFALASVAGYTGNSPDLSALYATALTRYRDAAVFSDGGSEQGHHVYPRGLRRDHEVLGHSLSFDAMILLANRAAGSVASGSPGYYGLDQAGSREVAFNGMAALAAESLGSAHLAGLETYAANALAHVAQWTAAPGSRLWVTYVRPFMVGLTCVFLVEYWDRYRDVASTGPDSQGDLAARIPAAVKSALDWVRANCWADPLPGQPGGFRYTDRDLTNQFDDIPGTVQSGSPAPTATAFRGPNGLSSQDDYYANAYVQFTSGALAGQVKICSSYTGATRTLHFDHTGGAFDQFTAAPTAGDAFSITYQGVGTGTITTGDDLGDASSLNVMVSHAAAWYYWFSGAVLGSRDNAYRQYHDDCFLGQATLFAGVFLSQKEWNETFFSSLLGLDWRSRGDAEWPAATALTMTAPGSAGRVNALSPPFTVALAGGDVSTPDPVTVTPHDGGTGTFFPATVTLTAKPGRPSATFRYRPDASGPKTISVTNDGGLTNPSPRTYTPSGTAGTAMGYTVTVGPVQPPGQPTTLTVALDPPGSVPPASCDALAGVALINAFTTDAGYSYFYAGPGASGGAMGNPYIALSGDNPSVTLGYIPPTAGTRTLTFRADGGLLTDPSPFALEVSARRLPGRFRRFGRPSG